MSRVAFVLQLIPCVLAQLGPYGSMNFGQMTAPGGLGNQDMYNMLSQQQQYGGSRMNGAMMYPNYGNSVPQLSMNSQFGSMNQFQPSQISGQNFYPGSMGQMGSAGAMGQMGSAGAMGQMGSTGAMGQMGSLGQLGAFNAPGQDFSSYGQQRYGFNNQGLGMIGQFQGDGGMNSVPREENTRVAGATRIIPPFLKTASKAEQDKFYQIVQHPSWTAREKQEKIEEFVRGLEVDAQNLYAEFQRSSLGTSSDKQRRVHSAVNSMTPEAQAQFQKVSALMTNPTLSDSDRMQKIQQIYDKIPDNIKKEFDSKFTDL